MVKTINDIQEEIIDDFSLFDDWMEKYEHLIEYGKSLPLIDDKYKTDEYLVRGCQSKVWLKTLFKDGKVSYYADSDAIITKGLVGMIVQVLSGHTPKEIIDADLYFIEKTGLKEHLSPNRSNGLVSMIRMMKAGAVIYNI